MVFLCVSDPYGKQTGHGHSNRTPHGVIKYKFVNTTYSGFGKLNVRIPIIDDYFIYVEHSIVVVDVPLLIGLYVLSRLKVLLDLSYFIMSSTTEDCTVPLSIKLVHSYIELTAYFTPNWN